MDFLAILALFPSSGRNLAASKTYRKVPAGCMAGSKRAGLKFVWTW
jgi:hypothetical protein